MPDGPPDKYEEEELSDNLTTRLNQLQVRKVAGWILAAIYVWNHKRFAVWQGIYD